jgi:transposase
MTAVMEQDAFRWFIGIDWGTAEHVVNLGDATGRFLEERTVKHTSEGLAQLLDWLTEVSGGQLAQVAVAIEIPRGALVELLLERGAAVFAVNPKQLDRFRDRFSVAGAKDDHLDARVLRSAVHTDRTLFRRLAIDEPLVIRVRELTRASEVLQLEFQALANRLRELVHRIAPEWLSLSPNADDPWFWTVVEWAATPALGAALRRRKVQTLLTTSRIRRVSVDDVLTVFERPGLTVAPGTVEAVIGHIQLLLPRVRLVQDQRHACERELASVLTALRTTETPPPPPAGSTGAQPSSASSAAAPGDVAILESLPGVGLVVTSSFIADAMPLLRLRDYASLRAVTGVAPVRRQTGKNKRGMISMRYACNVRLRNACYHFARVSTQVDAAARHYYAVLRARGHSHGRALRSVADRWLRILISMLTHRTLYDPTRFAVAGGVPTVEAHESAFNLKNTN